MQALKEIVKRLPQALKRKEDTAAERLRKREEDVALIAREAVETPKRVAAAQKERDRAVAAVEVAQAALQRAQGEATRAATALDNAQTSGHYAVMRAEDRLRESVDSSVKDALFALRCVRHHIAHNAAWVFAKYEQGPGPRGKKAIQHISGEAMGKLVALELSALPDDEVRAAVSKIAVEARLDRFTPEEIDALTRGFAR